MPKIVINRISQYENRGRKIKLAINDRIVAKIKNGEKIEMEVSQGKHIVQAKIDWCTSNRLEIDVDNHSIVHLELGSGQRSGLYRAFFDSKNFLELKVLAG